MCYGLLYQSYLESSITLIVTLTYEIKIQFTIAVPEQQSYPNQLERWFVCPKKTYHIANRADPSHS